MLNGINERQNNSPLFYLGPVTRPILTQLTIAFNLVELVRRSSRQHAGTLL